MDNAASTSGLIARFPALRRLGRRRRRIPLIQQLTATECGVACLAMVLGYHGKAISREELRDVLCAGRDGTKARDILNAARYYGLRGRGVKLSLDALRFLQPGAILHWGFNHFVVFDGLAGGGADILDPALGRRRVRMDELSRCFTGVALVLEPSDQFKRSAAKAAGGLDLARLLWGSGEWGRVLTASAFLQLLLLALPLLTGAVVDRVIPRGDRHLLLVLSVGLASIVVFHLLTSMIRAHLLLHVRTLVDARMTLGFLDRLIALPFEFFQRRSAGDLMMRLNSNVLIRQILTSSVLSGILDGALVLAYLALLAVVSAGTAVLVLAFGAIHIGVFLATRGRQREVNALLLARQARSQSYQVEMFAGMETLKAMGAEPRAQARWSNLFVDVLNVSLEEGRLAATLEAVSSTLRMGAPLAILGVGAAQVLQGGVSLGTMLALNTLAIGVFTPLSNLISIGTQLELLQSYIERIADVAQASPEQDDDKVRLAGALQGEIELDRVSFRYGPLAPTIVKDVSVKIAPGQMVAIVGRSGSGKSSLASLMLGLYRPSAGRILYDSISLAELDLRSVRRQLGIVTQQTYLFGGSVRANIALSDPDIPLEAVVEAAKRAQIHEDIVQMPMSYETLLIDGGGSLSGGQRQRVALARALVRKPSILLLDEATSALDAITERQVQDELAKLKCTRVVIAHRLSTIRRADCILVMEGGCLVEQGTHDQLMAAQGIYAQLIGTQLEAPEGRVPSVGLEDALSHYQEDNGGALQLGSAAPPVLSGSPFL